VGVYARLVRYSARRSKSALRNLANTLYTYINEHGDI
jgi:hypothetical protein